MEDADRIPDSIEEMVHAMNLSAADKDWVLNTLTDSEHLGEIRDEAQYAAFKRTAAALDEQAVAQGIPVRTLATADAAARERWLAWTRTFPGTMLTAIDAAILAWDEEHT